jgi:hypothetical protein
LLKPILVLKKEKSMKNYLKKQNFVCETRQKFIGYHQNQRQKRLSQAARIRSTLNKFAERGKDLRL